MAFELFKLAGSIFIDTQEADKSLAKTSNSAESFGSTLGNVIGVVGDVGLTVVNMAVDAGEALWNVATDASATADNIDKMSAKIGISKEGFQEWSYIMGQNGMDVDRLQTGVKTLSDLMDKANTGTSSAIETFDRLGVSFQNQDGSLKSAEDMMNETILALAEMEEGAERTALAVDLFGKAGTEMMPMLNTGAEGIEELRDRANELGLVMSDEAVNAGVAFGDIVDDLQQSFGMLATNLGSALLPILTEVVSAIVNNIPMIQEAIGQFSPVIASLFENLLPPFLELSREIFPTVVDLINQLIPTASEIIQSLLPVLLTLMQSIVPTVLHLVQTLLPSLLTIIESLMPIIEALLPLVEPLLDIALAIIEPLLGLITEIIPPLADVITFLLNDALVPLITFCMEGVGQAIEYVMSQISGFLVPIINSVIDVLKGVIEFLTGVFTGNWEMAWNGVKDVFTGIWDTIVNYFKGILNMMINSLNLFIKGINKIKIPDWIPEIGGKNANIPEIPALAKGGIIESAGSVLVGEKAPEILDLPSGARVRPLDSNVGLSKGDITEAFKEALMSVGLELTLSANSDAIFDGVVEKNTIYRQRHNGASALA